MITRRQALRSSLFGAGSVALRSLATGLPAALLLDPHRALADGVVPACGTGSPQFVILSTSRHGDPLGCNAPGTYDDARIVHPADPRMAATALSLAGAKTTAAAPWATLPQHVLDRTSFWHVMTDTPVHGMEQTVLKLNGLVTGNEMLPSHLAQLLAPCLGTIQAKPVSVATSPAESLTSQGKQLPLIPPRSLRATLATPDGPLKDLQALRDQSLNEIYGVYKESATPAQRAFIDSLVTSQREVRRLSQDLLADLSGITDDSANAQIVAAITLIKMKVTPLVALNIPFGADNHSDPDLALETSQTVEGVDAIRFLVERLAASGLADKVTFMSLNVFGRTLGPGNENGRQHNPNHQVSVLIGKPFRGGVIGAVGPVQGDFGALPIEAKSGKPGPGADITALESLASFGKTVLAGAGVDATGIAAGKVVRAALA